MPMSTPASSSGPSAMPGPPGTPGTSGATSGPPPNPHTNTVTGLTSTGLTATGLTKSYGDKQVLRGVEGAVLAQEGG